MRKYIAVSVLLLLAFYPNSAATPKLTNTVEPFLITKQEPFPDYRENYQKTVVEPAEAARKAAEEQARIQAEQQAQVAYTAPTPPTNDYKLFIYNAESGNNPGAINPYSGACGLGQALPCSKMGCSLSDYSCQDAFFNNYAISRYGSWYNAYQFWLANRWW